MPTLSEAWTKKNAVTSGQSGIFSMFMVSKNASVREIVEARERYVIADWQRGEVWGTENEATTYRQYGTRLEPAEILRISHSSGRCFGSC